MRKHFLANWGAYIGSLCLGAMLTGGYVFYDRPELIIEPYPVKELPPAMACEDISTVGCRKHCGEHCFCEAGGRCCEACRD